MDNKEFRLKEKSYRCFFEVTLDIIGGKWKPVILYHLGTAEVLRYAQLRRLIPKITERMLTKQLRELEVDGLVNRKVYPQVPPKVEYRLTKEGETLMPVLVQLKCWGEGYFNDNIDKFDNKVLEMEN